MIEQSETFPAIIYEAIALLDQIFSAITMDARMSAEGAAQWNPGVPHLRRSILLHLYLIMADVSQPQPDDVDEAEQLRYYSRHGAKATNAGQVRSRLRDLENPTLDSVDVNHSHWR